MADQDYEQLRLKYKPAKIEWLFIAESPPPAAGIVSTRHFYRTGITTGDRLFTNTIKALYPETAAFNDQSFSQAKPEWLERFKTAGCYMIESLEESMPHGATSTERKHKILNSLPGLIAKVASLASSDTKIILIKSNPFVIATEPLRQAGFKVLNQALLDYPGYWREEPYRTKLAAMMKDNGWKPD